MLQSRHDADDAMQAAMFRAWRAIARFEGRSSVRTWLVRIATNTCLDLIARRRAGVFAPEHHSLRPPDEFTDRSRQGETQIGSSPDDRHALEDGDASPEASYEQREAVELAFIAAHQHLSPRQRAALILREVLGMTASEVAGILDTSPTAVNSALQRARATLKRRNPQRGEQMTARAAGEGQLAEIVDPFVDAFVRSDVGVVIALLVDDARVGTHHPRNDGPEFRAQARPDRVHDPDRGFARSQRRFRQPTE